jgi:DNA-binding transcriptional MerR regulator
MSEELGEPTFGIGSVSRLTGIPMDTLRVWERRYNAVTPQRSEHNRRYYTRADVARLMLIKQLVDRGHAVGSVVHLPEEALRERLRVHGDLQAEKASAPDEPERRATVLVYGDTLPFLARRWEEEMTGLDLIGSHSVFADFERDALARRPEVLVAEFPALHADAAAQIRDLAHRGAARRTVLVYGFAPSPVLEKLGSQGMVALRAPVTAEVLEEACLLPNRSAGDILAEAALSLADPDVPPRRFDGASLAAIARTATRVQCECPHHLTDLVSRIGAFEAYSADCEHRNEQDAILHVHLHRTAGQARALLEEALVYLLKTEGLDVEALTLPEAAPLD